jgi:hypothetical protein
VWIHPERVQGLRRAVAVAVGEKHSIALQGFWVPRLPTNLDLKVLLEDLQAHPHALRRGSLSTRSSSESAPPVQECPSRDSIGGLVEIARMEGASLCASCSFAMSLASWWPRTIASLRDILCIVPTHMLHFG